MYNITFKKCDDVIHFYFPRQLIHKAYVSGDKGKKYFDEVKKDKLYFYQEVAKQLTENRVYREKVMLYILSVYVDAVIPDMDNLEIKGLIDAITANCMIDDNPSRMSYVMDGRVGESDEIHVFVIPYSKFPTWIKSQEGELWN